MGLPPSGTSPTVDNSRAPARRAVDTVMSHGARRSTPAPVRPEARWVVRSTGAGRGAGAGAAVGATVGLLQAALSGGGESSQIYRNFVATCLSDRGYRVIGWEMKPRGVR